MESGTILSFLTLIKILSYLLTVPKDPVKNFDLCGDRKYAMLWLDLSRQNITYLRGTHQRNEQNADAQQPQKRVARILRMPLVSVTLVTAQVVIFPSASSVQGIFAQLLRIAP